MRVLLPDEGRPELVPRDQPDQSLIAVINQCATLERLLDVLEWAQSDPELAAFSVEHCHPTTSSTQSAGQKAIGDNDLVLIGSDGHRARFEDSDVASNRDGNSKEQKDLIGLGVLAVGRGEARYAVEWPRDRLFLVVSEEFAERLRRPIREWLK